MQTYLGASSTLTPLDIDPEKIRSARIIYLEGYLWDPPLAKEAFLKAATIAHAASRKVALSLSDSYCVDRHRSSFMDFVANHVDILLANEDEALSLFQTRDLDRAVQAVRGQCRLAVVTRGAKGSLLISPEQTLPIDAEPVTRVVDTTGAGDLFACGFLFGVSQNLDLSICGRLGSIAAAEIVSHVGARTKASLRALVKEKLGLSVYRDRDAGVSS